MAFYKKGESAPTESPAEPYKFNSELLTTVNNLKVHLFPEAKNQILVRLENMSDLFDGTPEATEYFHLEDYCYALYARANGGAQAQSVVITERTLSNNQSMANMLVEKFHWKTEDPASPVTYPDDTSDGYAMQPQRIRLFRVFFNSEQQHPELFLQ